MESKVIYEKEYPPLMLPPILQEDPPAKPNVPFPEYIAAFDRSLTRIPVRRRLLRCRQFIRQAIRISKKYKLTVKIQQYQDHVSVDFSTDFGSMMGFLKPLFITADQYFFFVSKDTGRLTIGMDYYTHEVYGSFGWRLAP